MAIPAFDHNNVLPPYTVEPTSQLGMSPHYSTILEFCKRFGTNTHRIKLLLNLLHFRKEIQKNGLFKGFQWIGGSFVTNKEEINPTNPFPVDIDMITLFYGTDLTFFNTFDKAFPSFNDTVLARKLYLIDHYNIPIDYLGPDAIDDITYWLQLLSTTRSGIRKGIIKLDLNTPQEDQRAFEFINSLKK